MTINLSAEFYELQIIDLRFKCATIESLQLCCMKKLSGTYYKAIYYECKLEIEPS